MQILTVMSMDREGAGGGLSHQGTLLMDFIMFVVFAHLAIVLDPNWISHMLFSILFCPCRKGHELLDAPVCILSEDVKVDVYTWT